MYFEEILFMDNLLKVSAKDYIPLELFSLKWRFTDPKYNELPKEKLAQIKPLNKKTSFDLHEHARIFLNNFHLDINRFKSIENLDTPHEYFLTREWLENKLPKESKEIIVSWDAETSVRVDREIFYEYWDDFCYEGSDDIVIIPINGEWLMYYFHEDQFQFGCVRNGVRPQ